MSGQKIQFAECYEIFNQPVANGRFSEMIDLKNNFRILKNIRKLSNFVVIIIIMIN